MKPNTTSNQLNNHSPWQEAPREAKGLLQSFLGRTDRLTLCAEIERLHASTDGSFVLKLSLALGKLELLISEAQAETLSAAHACTFSVRRLGELIVADLKALDPYCPRPACCWVSSPGMHMARPQSLDKLKEVLGALKPTHQAVVLSMLAHSRAEKTLRTGVAALDHHCYPGGWLDASLKAVDVIKGRKELGTDQRSLLSAAALIFDAGRLTRSTIGMDSERLVMVGRDTMHPRRLPLPHASTTTVMWRAYQGLKCFEPRAAECLEHILGEGSHSHPLGIILCDAILQAWDLTGHISLRQSYLQYLGRPEGGAR